MNQSVELQSNREQKWFSEPEDAAMHVNNIYLQFPKTYILFT